MYALERPEWHTYKEVYQAHNAAEVELFKKAQKDPIIFQADGHVAYLYSKDPEILNRIKFGHRWSMGDNTPDGFGYVVFTYTELSADKLEDHLNNPTEPKRD